MLELSASGIRGWGGGAKIQGNCITRKYQYRKAGPCEGYGFQK